MKSDREQFLQKQAQSFEREAELQSRCNWSKVDDANVKHLQSQAQYFRQELAHEKEKNTN